MPNNSSARQKRQSKKKKTDPTPLQKEDKASADDRIAMDKASLDTSSLSLSPVGTKEAANIAVPMCSDADLVLECYRSLSDQEKQDLQEEAKRANSGVDQRVASKEFSAVKRAFMLKAALEARDRKVLDTTIKDSGFCQTV